MSLTVFSSLPALGAALLLATVAGATRPSYFASGPASSEVPTTITITRVPTPWYGFRWLLLRGFQRAVPEYEAIAGLRQKNFARSLDGAHFGGIYLWQDEAAARSWFTPAWFDRVRATYHGAGEVAYYEVLDRQTLAAPAALTGDYYTVLAFGQPVPAVAPAPAAGLLRLTNLREAGTGRAGTLTLWTNRAAAERVYGRAGARAGVTFFETPVLIDHELTSR